MPPPDARVRPVDRDWVADLRRHQPGTAGARAVERDLHDLLMRAARTETARRSGSTGFRGPEVDDLAVQAADDAMVAVLDKLDDFRGASRFTTWAYKFVIFEITHKLGRHFWTRPTVDLEDDEWEGLPDRLGMRPEESSEADELLRALSRAVERDLTPMQRECFVAVVLRQVPLEAHAERTGAPRGSVYKAVYDARRKLRAGLAQDGYLEEIR